MDEVLKTAEKQRSDERAAFFKNLQSVIQNAIVGAFKG